MHNVGSAYYGRLGPAGNQPMGPKPLAHAQHSTHVVITGNTPVVAQRSVVTQRPGCDGSSGGCKREGMGTRWARGGQMSSPSVGATVRWWSELNPAVFSNVGVALVASSNGHATAVTYQFLLPLTAIEVCEESAHGLGHARAPLEGALTVTKLKEEGHPRCMHYTGHRCRPRYP
jgi:hypothetical protein